MYQFHDKVKDRVEDKTVKYLPKQIYGLVRKPAINK